MLYIRVTILRVCIEIDSLHVYMYVDLVIRFIKCNISMCVQENALINCSKWYLSVEMTYLLRLEEFLLLQHCYTYNLDEKKCALRRVGNENKQNALPEKVINCQNEGAAQFTSSLLRSFFGGFDKMILIYLCFILLDGCALCKI